MKKMGLFVFLLFGFCLTGCHDAPSTTVRRPPLAPGADTVAVYDRIPPDCTPQDRITGRAASSESGEVVWKYALNDLRNQAAARQFFTVFMERYNHRTEKNLLVIEITGVLLNCSRVSPPEPKKEEDTLTPPPGEENDTIPPPPPPEENTDVPAPPDQSFD